MLKTKRIYEPSEEDDGARYLVERLWPRGIKKENLAMTAWLKDVAPSQALRIWYGHDVSKWDEFQRRYREELAANSSGWQGLLEAAQGGNVTLLYTASDMEHNSALVLNIYLEERLALTG